MSAARRNWILGGALIVLLTAINVQLFTAQHPPSREANRPATVPALPDDGGDEDRGALLHELDAMTAGITQPIEALRKDLKAEARANAATIGGLGPQLAAFGRRSAAIQAALRDLGETGRRLLQETAGIQSLPVATAELRRLRRTFASTLKELRALREETHSLSQGIPELAQQLAATRGNLSDVTRTLRDTNAALDRSARCLRRPIICR